MKELKNRITTTLLTTFQQKLKINVFVATGVLFDIIELVWLEGNIPTKRTKGLII